MRRSAFFSEDFCQVFAGDVSYDNSLIGCACIWDKFLSNWDKIRVKPKDPLKGDDDDDDQGYMIPLIFTTGNHDLGVNVRVDILISIFTSSFV